MTMPTNGEWTGPQSQEQPWAVGDKVRVNLPGTPYHGAHGEVTLISFFGRMQSVEVLEDSGAWRMNFQPGDLCHCDTVLPHEDPDDEANQPVGEVPALDPDVKWPADPAEQKPKVVDLEDFSGGPLLW